MFWSDEAWTPKFPPEVQSLQMFMKGIDSFRTLETKQTLKFFANLAKYV